MKHRLLLVDDQDASLFRSFCHSVPSDTWEVSLATNAKQAIKKSYAGETDLVVMALDSRASSGWEAIDEITKANPLLPVIVITKQPGLKNLAEAVGARALVEQPVDAPSLLQTMRQLLGQRMEKHAHGNRTAGINVRQVASSSGDSLENLQQRYNAPYASVTPFRHWGINE